MSDPINVTIETNPTVVNLGIVQEESIEVNFRNIAVPDPSVMENRLLAQAAAVAAAASELAADASADSAASSLSAALAAQAAAELAETNAETAKTAAELAETNAEAAQAAAAASQSAAATSATNAATSAANAATSATASATSATASAGSATASANSATAAANSASSIGLTTKGDLLTRNGSAYTRLAVGTDGKFLKANSGAAEGIEWADFALADNSVTTAKILDANVTTVKILDANITTAKILDANVTKAKLATGAKDLTTQSKTTAYTILNTDEVVLCDATSGAFTVTLPTAVGITGRQFSIKKTDTSVNAITIATTNSQTIGHGSPTTKKICNEGGGYDLVSDGANWKILNAHIGKPGEVWLRNGNGYGSTNTRIRRFTTTELNVGGSITYAESAANGASLTINEDGLYCISYVDNFTGADYLCFSKNSNQLTSGPSTPLTAAHTPCGYTVSLGANTPGCHAGTVSLVAGDIIRPHAGGTAQGSQTGAQMFHITQVAKT